MVNNTFKHQAWVARDKSGELWLYGDEKPRKRNQWSDDGAWASDGVLMEQLDSSLFPSVNWGRRTNRSNNHHSTQGQMNVKEFLKLLETASPTAEIKVENGVIVINEPEQDITERIKTFEDAYDWCECNDKENLVLVYNETCWRFYDMADMQDVFAYLKLRIITAALNEGWEPTFTENERKYYPIYNIEGELVRIATAARVRGATPWTLYYKSAELAQYAANQFRDIYADFCGFKKGGEE